jgi:hypothetical protein
MEPRDVMAALPARSPYREIVRDLMSSDAETRHRAYERLTDLQRPRDEKGQRDRLPPEVARTLLDAAMSLRFPPQKWDWHDAAHELIFGLLDSPHASLAEPAARAYPRLTDHQKSAILALLGAIGTREAAAAFMGCVREHGWPSEIYERVFTELHNLMPHAGLMFPELIRLAGGKIGGVVDVLTSAVSDGTIDLARDGIDLEPVADLVEERLARALAAVAKHQRRYGIAWRFGERYFGVRMAAGAWLDIAGYLRAPALTPLLTKAQRLRDPRLVAFAVGAALRRREAVAPAALKRAAACHETRVLLFEILERFDRLELFPAAYRTWDMFAAADMVNWLMYPAELGREPDKLEKAAMFTAGRGKDQVSLYVWRFKNTGGRWLAGVSGAYRCTGAPVPLSGSDTFSGFDEWKSATAEEHAEDLLETLADWRKHA